MIDTPDARPRPRWRQAPVVVAALVVALAGGFVAAYLAFFTGSSPARLALSPSGDPTSSAPGDSAAAASPTGHWSAAAGSEAGYRVREKLADLPAQSDAVGRTTAVTGGMTVDSNGDRLVAHDVRVEVDLTKLQSDRSRRDNRIRTQGLESDRFPTATFVSAGDVAVPTDAASGKAFTVDVVGDLTLHGVTRQVTIPVQGRVDASGFQAAGSLKFAMSMFAIDPPSIGGFVTVEPDATLEFKVVMQHD
jgi:polyisoprenoid-binding protein YceI